jgi:hypothetical protein
MLAGLRISLCGGLGERPLSCFIQCAIASFGWLVVRAAEAHPDLRDDSRLLLGIPVGETAPCG